MSLRPTAWLVALAVLNAGCSLVSDGAHVIGYRTRRAFDDSREWHRDRRLAAAAWDEAARRTPGLSADFGDGFKEGFAAYLFRGVCEPPALPPSRYRTVRHQTPEGYRAAEDWLNGFRRGAADAQHCGLRELVTGPSAYRTGSLPEPVPTFSTPADLDPMPAPLPQPMAEPVAPVAAIVPAPTRSIAAPPESPRSVPAPRLGAEAAAGEYPGDTPGTAMPPIRLTLRQLARSRLVIVTPGYGAADPEPAPPPPRVTEESEPTWARSRSDGGDGPTITWRRTESPDVRAPTGDRGRIEWRGIGMSRAGSPFIGGP